MREYKLKEFLKNDLWIIILDILAVNAAYYGGLVVRFSTDLHFRETVSFYVDSFLKFAPFYTAICIVVFWLCKLYGGMWRYAGINDMNRIVASSVVTSIAQIVGTLLIGARMPVAYYVIGALFQFILITGIRFVYRIVVIERRKSSPKKADCLIVGGGDEAQLLHRLLDRGVTYRPISYVDAKAKGRTMDGLPLYRSVEEALEYRPVRCVFFADLSLSDIEKDIIRDFCEEREIKIRDYTNFFVYSGETDSYSGMREAVRGPQNGQMSIPFSPPDIGDAEIGEVVEVLRSGWITTGPRTKLLERRLAAFIETGRADIPTEKDAEYWNNRVVCLNSATAAEELNLRILGIREGDEVIVPAYTYTASASAAIHCGAIVKFVDIQKNGDKVSHAPEMDYEKLEAAINEKTKAIVVVDLAGIICDYERIFEIVERKKGLFKTLDDHSNPLSDLSSRIQKSLGRAAVVCDAAHALGASRIINGTLKYCGSIADFTSFSFHAVKNFTTAEGGASTWREIEGIENKEIYKFYQLLSLHGQSKDAFAKARVGAWEYDVVGPWYKCNMTDIMAAIGLRQLDRYPGLIQRRMEIIRKYDETCDELGLWHLNHHVDGMDSSNHLYLVRIPGASTGKRNEVIERMAKLGVATNVHYKPLPMMTAYKERGADIKDYPNTYNYYENLFTLPLHTLLTDEEVGYVCVSLKNVMQELEK